MLAEMYGGKIDDAGDFNVLRKIVDNFMTPEAFEPDHNVIKGLHQLAGVSEGEGEVLTLPEGTGWNEFREWVHRLPEREPPTYLGLPANAEKLLLVGQALEMMGKLSLVMGILDE
jgi:dynein heavy chain 1, cytosolic